MLIDIFAEMQSENLVTKADLTAATDKIVSESHTQFAALKTDMDWLKKLIFAVGIAVIIAALNISLLVEKGYMPF